MQDEASILQQRLQEVLTCAKTAVWAAQSVESICCVLSMMPWCARVCDCSNVFYAQVYVCTKHCTCKSLVDLGRPLGNLGSNCWCCWVLTAHHGMLIVRTRSRQHAGKSGT